MYELGIDLVVSGRAVEVEHPNWDTELDELVADNLPSVIVDRRGRDLHVLTLKAENGTDRFDWLLACHIAQVEPCEIKQLPEHFHLVDDHRIRIGIVGLIIEDGRINRPERDQGAARIMLMMSESGSAEHAADQQTDERQDQIPLDAFHLSLLELLLSVPKRGRIYGLCGTFYMIATIAIMHECCSWCYYSTSDMPLLGIS